MPHSLFLFVHMLKGGIGTVIQLWTGFLQPSSYPWFASHSGTSLGAQTVFPVTGSIPLLGKILPLKQMRL